MSDKLAAALHGARYLPAAAVPVGAVVRLPERPPRMDRESFRELAIIAVHNADPRPGRIRWETVESGDVEVGGADRVEVVSLP